MCGIAGYWSDNQKQFPADPVLGREMASRLERRGPDGESVWVNSEASIVLSHRRLSIIDLTETGTQPMKSESGRFVISFNGEIYNHLDLRKQVENENSEKQWNGTADTETLLACIEIWGFKTALQKTIGMFAIALWDQKKKSLTLARDRAGEKPLYYGAHNGVLFFASDLSALRVHPAFKAEINRNSLHLYTLFSYIPAPYSIYKDIHKLEPGQFVTYDTPTTTPQYETYWSLRSDAIEAGMENPFQGSYGDAVNHLETTLKDAVERQMISDVPLGAFLSGGIDSSTIVSLMQAVSDKPIRTFTIGTEDKNYNEAEHAKKVAEHLGTDHHELMVSPQQALDVIPTLGKMYAEPFSDSSQIPTHLVSKLARETVTVSLSGDGGDELFCGYNRYQMAGRFQRVSNIPRVLRRGLAKSIQSIGPQTYNNSLKHVRKFLPLGLSHGNLGDRLHKAASILDCKDVLEYYQRLVSTWQDPAELVLGGHEPETQISRHPPNSSSREAIINDMMALDYLTYLPDDILCKVDRAAMAVSLETRVPFLDQNVVEFAWSLPLAFKMQDNVGKKVLRDVLYKYVPKKLIERPKMGFGIPLDVWLRGPLREWAEHLLNEKTLREQGYFNADLVRKIWQQHIKGTHNNQYLVWNILMFQSWLESTKA